MIYFFSTLIEMSKKRGDQKFHATTLTTLFATSSNKTPLPIPQAQPLPIPQPQPVPKVQSGFDLSSYIGSEWKPQGNEMFLTEEDVANLQATILGNNYKNMVDKDFIPEISSATLDGDVEHLRRKVDSEFTSKEIALETKYTTDLALKRPSDRGWFSGLKRLFKKDEDFYTRAINIQYRLERLELQKNEINAYKEVEYNAFKTQLHLRTSKNLNKRGENVWKNMLQLSEEPVDYDRDLPYSREETELIKKRMDEHQETYELIEEKMLQEVSNLVNELEKVFIELDAGDVSPSTAAAVGQFANDVSHTLVRNKGKAAVAAAAAAGGYIAINLAAGPLAAGSPLLSPLISLPTCVHCELIYS